MCWRNELVFGRTLLHEAVCSNRCDLIRLLVQAGADLNMTNNALYEWTPLHEAVVHAGVKMTALLLTLGASTENVTASGQTPRDLLEVSRYCREKQEKELLFRLFLAQFDVHAPSLYEFRKFPVDVKVRIRVVLLCRAKLRLSNAAAAPADEQEANLGHADRFIINTIIYHLWIMERQARLETILEKET
jgi:hypothetical protein